MTAESPPAGPVATARAVYRLAADADLSLLAAALAYYAFASTVPLLVLGVLVSAAVGGPALVDRVVALGDRFLAPEGESLVRAAVTARTGAGGVTTVGLVVLLWGALRTFRALDRAFSRIYGTVGSDSLPSSISDALVALVAVGVGVLATTLVSTTVGLFAGPVGGLLGTAALVPTLVVVLLPLYYLFPDAPVGLREVLPGTVVVAVGWTLLGGAFSLYAATVASASLYGLLGAVLLGLTWLYLGALLLLAGAAVNVVLAGRAVDR